MLALSHCCVTVEGLCERTVDIFFFRPSLGGILFPMFCLLVEGECLIPCSYVSYTKWMSTYSNWLQPALQNLLQCVVRFFHPRLSCTMTHISADLQRITLNSLCMTCSGGRTKQLDIFCCVTGFTSDFLSFIVVELIQFFHGALQLFS